MSTLGTILLIDDDELLQRALPRILGAHGHHVITASTGEEGLALLAGEHQIDTVICDVAMPGLSGEDVLRRVRVGHAPPPVIMLTGQADLDLAVRLMKEGAFDYLVKPVTADKLTHTVNQALTQHAVSEENAGLRRLLEYQQAFISITSHELRTPLTIMAGFLDFLLMQDDMAPDKRRQFLQKVRTSTRTLQGLVEQIHSMALADAGLLPSQPEWTYEELDPIALAHRAMTEIQPLAMPRRQTLVLEQITPPSQIWGSAAYLQALLRELLLNAVRFSPDERIIVLRIAHIDSDIVFSVIDQGVGIAEEHQGRIFDRFYMANPKIRSPERGNEFMSNHLGIGLSIARAIVSAHNGKLTVDSTPGEGSTFTARLPLRPSGDVIGSPTG